MQVSGLDSECLVSACLLGGSAGLIVSWARPALAREPFRRFEQLAALFQTYGERYEFDWLLLASFAFQWTRNAASAGKTQRLKPGLVVTGLLTTTFLVGQYVAWQQLNASGHYVTSNPADAFFFLMTGVHALHILGGMYVWARATMRVFSGNDNVEESIQLCTVYWHFLLVVWLALFGLMLST